ncbi:hypothetical protein NLM27_26040 [Bradyrhizobium sp. CCGB12]|uniref:hypothetical protein n=1 Tax=Bradyrhizobium sp. CCGB12 TaxID=2949632 RepID=UPI0020B17952|nr:hypothetical protein [Bradyrhizobium sp. CCGB12]MCP3392234.1 hypothetical protein [Bradyrhizobium sp. CCGB12]
MTQLVVKFRTLPYLTGQRWHREMESVIPVVSLPSLRDCLDKAASGHFIIRSFPGAGIGRIQAAFI